MGVSEDQPATWAQDASASTAGAIASISVAQPLDVVKVNDIRLIHSMQIVLWNSHSVELIILFYFHFFFYQDANSE